MNQSTDTMSPTPPVANLAELREDQRMGPLVARLETEVTLQPVEIVLPRTRQQFNILVPTEAARDQVFRKAKDDPEQQKPHWANLWASGIALGDLALERSDLLAGRRVLELGCGLGVTATAAVGAGARLVATDYSVTSLMICRINTLSNTGRSPETLQVNWRRPVGPAMARADTLGRFPIILAADVLYESRDIQPIFAMLDRLLAPDGCVWLAEPGRKTAKRFLHTVAEAGWEADSIHIPSPWAADSSTHVVIHFLSRPNQANCLATAFGGWRF